jgi:NADH-quinone oxidoreductase subunit N
MLGYSSVAHSGYMLIGLLVGPTATGGPLRNGMSAMLFYIVAYGVMNLGAFAVLALVQNNGKPAEELDHLGGLSRRQPLTALAMAVCVFSLMGMPPTAGFFGKLYIFTSALSAGPNHPRQMALIVLAVIGAVNSAIAAAYYLRIIAACYLREPTGETSMIGGSGPLRLGLTGCCLAVLTLGLWPNGLIGMARVAHEELIGTPALPARADATLPDPPPPDNTVGAEVLAAELPGT